MTVSDVDFRIERIDGRCEVVLALNLEYVLIEIPVADAEGHESRINAARLLNRDIGVLDNLAGHKRVMHAAPRVKRKVFVQVVGERAITTILVMVVFG